ncbi:hypothetical protein CNR22_14985 [Sphingobacteriaceae bacterium]|nr:hypothetical protein CNR22_14985 [Sphingobacteriaceae bacterium]
MKKLFLSSLVISAHFMNAQLNKGTVLLGGDVGYYQTKNDRTGTVDPNQNQKSESKSLSLSLDAGYFVAQNFAIGIFAAHRSYTSNSDEVGNNYIRLYDTEENQSSFGGFARGYKLFADNTFGFFGELRGGYLTGSYETRDFYQPNAQPSQLNRRVDKGPGFIIGLRPGIVYFIRPRIGLEASFGNLSYMSQKTDNSYNGEKVSETKSNNLNLNLNVSSISLGVHVYLGGKQ